MTIRVLLADDQALLRGTFRMLIDSTPDMEVVGEAANGREAVDLAGTLGVDVLLMDIRMPDLDGLAATRLICADRNLTGVRVLMTVASLVAFYAGQAILSPYDEAVKMSDPGVAPVVFGTGLYLTVVGLLGVALGALIRNGAGAIATLVALLIIVPGLSHLLPSSWAPHVVPYLPSNAGGALLNVVPDPTLMSPWNGFALMVGYAVVLLAIAGALLKRRDA